MSPPIVEGPTHNEAAPKASLSTSEEVQEATPHPEASPVELASDTTRPAIQFQESNSTSENPQASTTTDSGGSTAATDTPTSPIDSVGQGISRAQTTRTTSSERTLRSIRPHALKSSSTLQVLTEKISSTASLVSKHKFWDRNQNHEIGQTQWGVHWYMPSCMALLALAGTCGAIGHHFYNLNLDGKVVKHSDWTQRFGIALALFNKLCLIGAVEIAYKQTVWLTVKRKPLRLDTIDSLFSACNDPLEFLNAEFLLKATIPALLAGLSWSLPLTAIASPASLTSVATITNRTSTCNNIPSLDFQRELTLTITSDENALCFWANKPDGTAYYNSPSDDLWKLSTIELLAGNGPLAPPNPCPISTNCSYTIHYNGPTYQCTDQPDFAIPTNASLTKDLLVPTGNYSYLTAQNILEDGNGQPLWWGNASIADVGNLTEPDFWVGWAINTTIPLADPITTPWDSVWGYQMDQKVMKCSMYTADYTYTLSWLNGVMSIDSTSRANFVPITSWSPDQLSIYPILSGYHAAGFIYRQKLSGFMNSTGDDGYVTTTSGISQTRLVDGAGWLLPDFETLFQDEFADTILSIASDAIMQSQSLVTTPCTVAKTELLWNYRPLWLVLSYSLGVVFMALAVVMGIFAYKFNGYGTDMSFSSILVTTRNKDLDALAEGSCLGNTPLPKHLTEERLRFGELRDGGRDGDVKHTAFGLYEHVSPIKIGALYS